MKTSRRRFAMLLPAIAAAQETAKRLPSQAFPFENLPSKISAVSKTHAVFTGETHTGYPLEVHVTELNAGASPHPPHQHLHEEMFCMQSGILDATVNGRPPASPRAPCCTSIRTICTASIIPVRIKRNTSSSRWVRRLDGRCLIDHARAERFDHLGKR